jgi:predicted transcriptional regulator of viral defense system
LCTDAALTDMRRSMTAQAAGMSDATFLPLLRRDDLLRDGVGDRALRRMLARGELRAVRPGVWARATDLEPLHAEGRAVVRARALAAVAAQRPILSHQSAAAVHGLPLVGEQDRRVHVIVPPERPGRAAGVVRHRGDLDAADVVEIDGLLCTSLARTTADIARTGSFASAVTIADAAARSVAVGLRRSNFDDDAANAFLRQVSDITRRSAHGQSRARRVVAFADGRADGAAESISRVRLDEIGFARPRLQYPVAGPLGEEWSVDIRFRDAPALGEVDGAKKYLDPALRHGLSTDEVVLAEKRREDWIRGVTGLAVVRWGWRDIATAASLAAHLAAFGIRPGWAR